ncbi:MAG: ATP-binding cassette domain-containing protein [Tannerellaceae bacterium]|jgi:molybdate transport system ATP-binding protein|nr:ATP-binding cassette domain-containing protein [Tannerellaceae bacterium]
MSNNIVVDIKNAVSRLPEFRFSRPLNWTIKKGEQWAVVGPNGAGKTLITNIMRQNYALKEGGVYLKNCSQAAGFIKSIAFKDIYSLAGFRHSYYQQRWHSTETDEIPLVEDFFRKVIDTEHFKELIAFFGIEDLLSKRIIFLSSGELRKFLIVNALLENPRILILDNPFIGLDTASRKLLAGMLDEMVSFKEIQIILLLSNPDELPEMITHVLPVRNKTVYPGMLRPEFLRDNTLVESLFPAPVETMELPAGETRQSSHTITFSMVNVSIKYGEQTILSNLNWEVRNGEKWALLGPNGSGKSTLLSLVFADNPQAYANTIYLFDRKRGSGESIWDIKKRIGYVSPEMHLYYQENVPAWQIVGSGFFDSIGLYRKCNTGQELSALKWMAVFGIERLKDRPFLSLSSGEQRLALLARAFVKNPDLLILDEPLHGLDISNKNKTVHIIEQFCKQAGKTLVYVTHYLHELPPCIDRRFELTKPV